MDLKIFNRLVDMDKKKLIKILVPSLIVLVVVGIWFAKNSARDSKFEGKLEGVTPLEAEHFELNAKTLDMEVLGEYNMPIILDFGSNTCLPCISFFPTLKNVHKDMYGKAIIKYVDVDKYPEIARIYPVQVVPTQIFINPDGTPYNPSKTMKQMGINFSLYSYKSTDQHAFTVHEGGLSEPQLLAILKDMGVKYD